VDLEEQTEPMVEYGDAAADAHRDLARSEVELGCTLHAANQVSEVPVEIVSVEIVTPGGVEIGRFQSAPSRVGNRNGRRVLGLRRPRANRIRLVRRGSTRHL
jgi:hypothetical protein